MNKLFVCTDGMIFVGKKTVRFPKNESRFSNPMWEKFVKTERITDWSLSYTFLKSGRSVSVVLSLLNWDENDCPLYHA